MITVRSATLADSAAISRIHCSDIEQWYRGYFDEEGVRQRIPATWEECSLIDRWVMGGAWMSPEMCAIHINRMLLADQLVLVAEEEGEVVGELEIFVGEDALYGYNANLSVFYVHKEKRGGGIGSILLNDAIDIVREAGCQTLTTYNPDIPAYYTRMGLVAERQLKLVVVPTQRSPVVLPLRRSALPAFDKLAPLPMLSGRILSSYQRYWQLQEEAAPGTYAIEAAWRPAELSYVIGLGDERAWLVFRDRSGQRAWGTVHLWAKAWSRELLQTVLSIGTELGFLALHFVVEEADVAQFADYPYDPPQDSTLIHCMRL